ncbi:hypothetical protein A4X13_0g1185 [Tilletia indica]|uniref:Uncharacterized protein n=1 Tax=Tilletia indica TaxID=43049 RepID=A0A177TT82_9BASI|nr:hypothetical protein A4X13_0g1185 [Tilletia indica]
MDIDSITPGAPRPVPLASSLALAQQQQQQQQPLNLPPPSPSSTSQSAIADEDVDAELDEEDEKDDPEDEFADITRGATSVAGGVFDHPPASSGPVPAARAVAASPNPRSALRTRTDTSTTLPGSGSFSGGLTQAQTPAQLTSFASSSASSSSSGAMVVASGSGSGSSAARTGATQSAAAVPGLSSRLPAEILNYILRFVATDPRDLARCLRVNQLWLRCGVELLWHRPTLRNIGTFHSLLRTLQPAGEAVGLKHLPARITVEHVTSSRRGARRERSADLDDEDDVDDDEEVDDAEQVAGGAATDPPTRDATPQPTYEPASPMDLSEPAPSSSASSTSDQGFSRPSSAANTNVTEPDQDYNRRQPTFHYEQFVRRLNFAVFAKDVTDDYLRWVAVCDRLERLTIAGCSEITDVGLCAILPHTPNLVAIDLTDVDKITDVTLRAIAQHCPKVQGINLSGCKAITGDGLADLARACKYLRRVKLCKCPLITDAGIKTLVRSCPLLLELDLLDAVELGDEGIAEMWRTSRHMRELRFAGIKKLTDAAFPDPAGRPPAAAGMTPLSFGSNPSVRVGNALAIPPLLNLSGDGSSGRNAPGTAPLGGSSGGVFSPGTQSPLLGTTDATTLLDRRHRSASPSPRGRAPPINSLLDSVAASSSSMSVDRMGIVSPARLSAAGDDEEDVEIDVDGEQGGAGAGSAIEAMRSAGQIGSVDTTGLNAITAADAAALHQQLVHHQARNLNAVHAAQQGGSSHSRHHHHHHHHPHRHHNHHHHHARDQHGHQHSSAPGSTSASRSGSHHGSGVGGGVGGGGGGGVGGGSSGHGGTGGGAGNNDPTPAEILSSASPLYRPFATRLFEQLRIIDLTSCSHLTDAAVEGIIANTPRIRNLVLNKCSGLTDRSAMAIARLGKNLHHLHLGHVQRITDRGVTAFARSCTRLRYIDLAYCSELTDQSLFEIAAHLPRLRRIGLVKVNNLTDAAIIRLVEKHTCLERIHLSYCDNITADAVFRLLTKLTKLTHLSLTGVASFRNSELQRFCREPPDSYNEQQRQNFCVYSGPGVRELRHYLQGLQQEFGAVVLTLDEAVRKVQERKEEAARLREVEEARMRELTEEEMAQMQAEMGAELNAEQMARSSHAWAAIQAVHAARAAQIAQLRAQMHGQVAPGLPPGHGPYSHHAAQQLQQQMGHHGPGFQSNFPGPLPSWVSGLPGSHPAHLTAAHAHAHAHAQAHGQGLAPSPASMAAVGQGSAAGLTSPGAGSSAGTLSTGALGPTAGPSSNPAGGAGGGPASTTDYHRAIAASMQDRHMRIAHQRALAAASMVVHRNGPGSQQAESPQVVAQAQALLAAYPSYLASQAAGASSSTPPGPSGSGGPPVFSVGGNSQMDGSAPSSTMAVVAGGSNTNHGLNIGNLSSGGNGSGSGSGSSTTPGAGGLSSEDMRIAAVLSNYEQTMARFRPAQQANSQAQRSLGDHDARVSALRASMAAAGAGSSSPTSGSAGPRGTGGSGSGGAGGSSAGRGQP